MLPFLNALQAITAGSRLRTLADDHALNYTEAAEVLLLIEALGEVGSNETRTIDKTSESMMSSMPSTTQGIDAIRYYSNEPFHPEIMPDYHANILALLHLDVDSLPLEKRVRMADELVQILNARVHDLEALLDDDEHPESVAEYLEKNVTNLMDLQLMHIDQLKKELAESRSQTEARLRREYEGKLRQTRESGSDDG